MRFAGSAISGTFESVLGRRREVAMVSNRGCLDFGQLAEIEWAEIELAQVEIGGSRTDGVCSVSSFSLACFFVHFIFSFFFFIFISLFILFLFSFCFRPEKHELNPVPRTCTSLRRDNLPPDYPPPDNPPRTTTGPPSAGQPSAGQPSAGQPSAGQPSAPKISILFSPHPATIFILISLSWGLFVEFWWCLKAGTLKCARLEFSGCRVKPWGPRPGRRGSHTTARELQTCTFQGPGALKHHQNSTRRRPRERSAVSSISKSRSRTNTFVVTLPPASPADPRNHTLKCVAPFAQHPSPCTSCAVMAKHEDGGHTGSCARLGVGVVAICARRSRGRPANRNACGDMVGSWTTPFLRLGQLVT